MWRIFLRSEVWIFPYESVRRWFLKFGAPVAQNLRHMRPIPNGYWHLNPHFQFDSDLSTFRRPPASLFIGARAR